MQKVSTLLLFLFALNSFKCSTSIKNGIIYQGTCTESDVLKVSISKVAEKPENFDNIRIQIEGVYREGFEMSALYSKSSSTNPKKAIWIDFNPYDSLHRIDSSGLEFEYSNLYKMSGKKIVIVGTFVEKNKGHLDQYAGTLRNICSVFVEE